MQHNKKDAKKELTYAQRLAKAKSESMQDIVRQLRTPDLFEDPSATAGMTNLNKSLLRDLRVANMKKNRKQPEKNIDELLAEAREEMRV